MKTFINKILNIRQADTVTWQIGLTPSHKRVKYNCVKDLCDSTVRDNGHWQPKIDLFTIILSGIHKYQWYLQNLHVHSSLAAKTHCCYTYYNIHKNLHFSTS